jgi:hypothetical protein
VDGAQVGIFEQANQVGLGGLLQGQDGGALKSQLSLEFVGDLSYQSLEGEFSHQQFSRFLVFPDFPQGDGAWSVTVGLLHASGGGGRFAGCLGGDVFPGGFSSGGFSCCVFGSGH